MTAYFIAAYDVENPDEFAKYNPGSLPAIMQTLERHGGKVLSAGGDGNWHADSRHVVVLLEFPSVEAAEAWENDGDYAPAKQIRLGSTGNRLEVIVPGFVPPSE